MRRKPVVVPVLLLLNGLVFLAWQVALRMGHPVAPWGPDATTAPPLLIALERSFWTSAVHLVHGRIWTLLLSAFSHMELWHLAINMIVLWSFGGLIERLLGRGRLIALYLTAAVFSSLSHCAVSALLIGQPAKAALGASGALSAVVLVYALLFPRHRILLFGVIPLPALTAALLFVGLDLWGLVAQARGGGLPIGHGAHLGGALLGFLWWAVALRRRGLGTRGPGPPSVHRSRPGPPPPPSGWASGS
jgi:membrane associated rhomboid family serine protease